MNVFPLFLSVHNNAQRKHSTGHREGEDNEKSSSDMHAGMFIATHNSKLGMDKAE